MKYTPPKGLESSGKRLWRGIAGSGQYELRPDELRLLEDACREADLIDALEAEAQGLPKLVKGSTGQLVINPLISEVRQHRSTLAALMVRLKLPDSQSVAAPRSIQARSAAASRWSKPA
jgi:hypothetical protein